LTNLSADTLAGKKVGGAEGMRKAAAKRAAEDAEFFHAGKGEKENAEKKAINAELRTNSDLAQRHAEASQAVDTHETEHKAATESHKAAQEELVRAVAAMERARGGDAEVAAAAEQTVKSSKDNLNTQTERIKRATQQLGLAKQVVKNIEDEAKTNAIASGNLRDFKSEGEIAATIAQNRFGARFSTAEENRRIAELARKEVKDHHEKKEAKKIADYLKEKTGDGHGHDVPKPAAAPKPQVHETHGADQGHGDAHAGGHGDEHGEHH
jgi:hypothetical protein